MPKHLNHPKRAASPPSWPCGPCLVIRIGAIAGVLGDL